jgi:hypothetical protein
MNIHVPDTGLDEPDKLGFNHSVVPAGPTSFLSVMRSLNQLKQLRALLTGISRWADLQALVGQLRGE